PTPEGLKQISGVAAVHRGLLGVHSGRGGRLCSTSERNRVPIRSRIPALEIRRRERTTVEPCRVWRAVSGYGPQPRDESACHVALLAQSGCLIVEGGKRGLLWVELPTRIALDIV